LSFILCILRYELYSYFEYLKFGNAAHINLDICNFYLEGIGRKEIKKNIQEVWSVLKEQAGIMRYLYLPMRILQFIKYS
jgi:hypothetical protein